MAKLTGVTGKAMELADFVDQLARALCLPDLQPEADGSAALRVHGIEVLLAPRPAGEAAFVARARLGALAASDAAQCLPALMTANFFADGIGGAVVSLDGRDDVYLTAHFDLRTASFPLLWAGLQRFVGQARRCQDLLPTGSAPAWPLLAEGVVQA